MTLYSLAICGYMTPSPLGMYKLIGIKKKKKIYIYIYIYIMLVKIKYCIYTNLKRGVSFHRITREVAVLSYRKLL